MTYFERRMHHNARRRAARRRRKIHDAHKPLWSRCGYCGKALPVGETTCEEHADLPALEYAV